MAISETEIISTSLKESEPPVHLTDHHNQPKLNPTVAGPAETHPFSSLGRQSSIYSLTLDEFQHALCESGKNFGSMNMDEFLTSIWNAEENQQQTAPNNITHQNTNNYNNATATLSGEPAVRNGGFAKQPSLPRQGSLSLPAPLSRKTVDEVWSEIHNNVNGGDNSKRRSANDDLQNTGTAAGRQPTFGEMTLEDFLVKAGVVREQSTNPPTTVKPPQFGVFHGGNNPNLVPAFPSRPISVADTSGYSGGSDRADGGGGGGYPQATAVPPPPICFGGAAGNGAVGMVRSMSLVSSDGMGNQYGKELGDLRGNKRMIDRPVERVVERRQRLMIKNRESAARSRARKQAYTVELEAELNELKEENAQLKRVLAEMERTRRLQYYEEMKVKRQKIEEVAREKSRTMRRTKSCVQ